jgi:hypothetical protein
VDYKERGWIHITGQGPVINSFEHGKEPLGFIKSREFVDQLTRPSASEVVLCYRQLVPRAYQCKAYKIYGIYGEHQLFP